MCWVFDVSPSQLRGVFWSNSHRDVKMRMRLKAQFQQVMIVQQYSTIASIISRALGGKPEKRKRPGPPKGLDEKLFPQTEQELRAVFQRAFG